MIPCHVCWAKLIIWLFVCNGVLCGENFGQLCIKEKETAFETICHKQIAKITEVKYSFASLTHLI